MCSIKGNNKLLFNETTSLAIVALFSSNTEMGSLVFVVSGYLFFPSHYQFLFLHANQPKHCVFGRLIFILHSLWI